MVTSIEIPAQVDEKNFYLIVLIVLLLVAENIACLQF